MRRTQPSLKNAAASWSWNSPAPSGSLNQQSCPGAARCLSSADKAGWVAQLGCPALPALQGLCCLFQAHISELNHASSLQQEGNGVCSGVFPSVWHQLLPAVSTAPEFGFAGSQRCPWGRDPSGGILTVSKKKLLNKEAWKCLNTKEEREFNHKTIVWWRRINSVSTEA